ncbi:MAG: methylated-DNA--[protein]-cysteine S-methyltransferase [Burkholderiales bacterium]|nr:methylated-DNA--[protein]-cysteine S-methyltransferase [Burkholderiales bacterium]
MAAFPSTPYSAKLRAPFGVVGIRTRDEAIAAIDYLPHAARELAPRDHLAAAACAQITRYLADPDFVFNLPLQPSGTDFQRRVWACIAAIPRGGTRAYGELARELGSSARPVGQACGANPFPLVIPCHRVVSAVGIGGFAHHAAGFHVAVKRWLLAHERGDRR